MSVNNGTTKNYFNTVSGFFNYTLRIPVQNRYVITEGSRGRHFTMHAISISILFCQLNLRVLCIPLVSIFLLHGRDDTICIVTLL